MNLAPATSTFPRKVAALSSFSPATSMQQHQIDAPKCISQKGISVSILIDDEELDLYVLNDEMNIVCQVNKAYRIKVPAIRLNLLFTYQGKLDQK